MSNNCNNYLAGTVKTDAEKAKDLGIKEADLQQPVIAKIAANANSKKNNELDEYFYDADDKYWDLNRAISTTEIENNIKKIKKVFIEPLTKDLRDYYEIPADSKPFIYGCVKCEQTLMKDNLPVNHIMSKGLGVQFTFSNLETSDIIEFLVDNPDNYNYSCCIDTGDFVYLALPLEDLNVEDDLLKKNKTFFSKRNGTLEKMASQETKVLPAVPVAPNLVENKTSKDAILEEKADNETKATEKIAEAKENKAELEQNKDETAVSSNTVDNSLKEEADKKIAEEKRAYIANHPEITDPNELNILMIGLEAIVYKTYFPQLNEYYEDARRRQEEARQAKETTTIKNEEEKKVEEKVAEKKAVDEEQLREEARTKISNERVAYRTAHPDIPDAEMEVILAGIDVMIYKTYNPYLKEEYNDAVENQQRLRSERDTPAMQNNKSKMTFDDASEKASKEIEDLYSVYLSQNPNASDKEKNISRINIEYMIFRKYDILLPQAIDAKNRLEQAQKG